MVDEREDILNQELVVTNLGLPGVAESLKAQDVEIIQVEWEPPAGGDQEMIDLLDKLL
jgi:hypothetical protein